MSTKVSSKNEGAKSFQIRKVVFIPMVLIYLSVIILGIVSPEAFASAESAIVNFAGHGSKLFI